MFIIVIVQYSFTQTVTVVHVQISDQLLAKTLDRRWPLLTKSFNTSDKRISSVRSLCTCKINKLFSLFCVIVDRKYVLSLRKALKDHSLEVLVADMTSMIFIRRITSQISSFSAADFFCMCDIKVCISYTSCVKFAVRIHSYVWRLDISTSLPWTSETCFKSSE